MFYIFLLLSVFTFIISIIAFYNLEWAAGFFSVIATASNLILAYLYRYKSRRGD